jgi:hypothetical protein
LGHNQDVEVEVAVGEFRFSHFEIVADDVQPSYAEPEPQNNACFTLFSKINLHKKQNKIPDVVQYTVYPAS